jgi:hypothetical protein
MMTPSSYADVLNEVRQLLARAQPAQTQHLLRDIMHAAPVVNESVKHDA